MVSLSPSESRIDTTSTLLCSPMTVTQMRVYRLDQSEIELVDELDVAIDLLKHRVDDQRLAAAPAGDEIGVSPGHAVEELAEDHHCDSPIRGLRIPSAPCAQYKSSMVRQKEARSPLSAGRRLAALSRIAEDTRCHRDQCDKGNDDYYFGQAHACWSPGVPDHSGQEN